MGGDVRVKSYLTEVWRGLVGLLLVVAVVAVLGGGMGLPIWLITAHFSEAVGVVLSLVWILLYSAAIAPLLARLLEWRA